MRLLLKVEKYLVYLARENGLRNSKLSTQDKILWTLSIIERSNYFIK